MKLSASPIADPFPIYLSPTLTRAIVYILSQIRNSILDTVSRYSSVPLIQFCEHSNARCMPPSSPHKTAVMGGRIASNSVAVMVYISTTVKTFF